MPGSYLDEIYGLMPYGSDANPMNMEAMDMRPDDLRLADELEADRAKGPQPVVRPLRTEPPPGAEYPEGSRVDLGDGTERVYGAGGSFEVREVPLDTANFGDMTPPPGPPRGQMGPPAPSRRSKSPGRAGSARWPRRPAAGGRPGPRDIGTGGTICARRGLSGRGGVERGVLRAG